MPLISSLPSYSLSRHSSLQPFPPHLIAPTTEILFWHHFKEIITTSSRECSNGRELSCLGVGITTSQSCNVETSHLPWCPVCCQCLPDSTALSLLQLLSVEWIFPQMFSNSIILHHNSIFLLWFWISITHFFNLTRTSSKIFKLASFFFLWSSPKSPQNMFPHSFVNSTQNHVICDVQKGHSSSHLFQVSEVYSFIQLWVAFTSCEYHSNGKVFTSSC